MFKKFLSLLVLIGLIITTNLLVLAQNQSSAAEKMSEKRGFSSKEFFNRSERPNQLLDTDSFLNVNANSVSEKALRETERLPKKKNFVKLNKMTTALLIGAAVGAVVIIVYASRNRNDVPDDEIIRIPDCRIGPC
jgi:cell division protein FtsL